MTITYRTAGAWGAGKGSNLSPAEVDANFYELAQQILADLSDDVPPVGIANIVVSGSLMTIILDDATELGPYTLPAASNNIVEITTATHTMTDAQKNSTLRFTNAAGCVFTIPPDSVDFNPPLGSEVEIQQDAPNSSSGSGQVVIDVAATFVTLNYPISKEPWTAEQWSVVTARKVGANEWTLRGDLDLVSV